ncbi:RDD family protein [Mycolicibacterium goodii]|uniref:RDD family protein n=1 Tax=Mycolicibacterium goodii TaxID=134601 RepID=UPI000C267AAF|nr:RDD family protein [Mycolicibacterium goodii]PJK20607.1 RDD family protein [Mycolicibacterium goodii]
MTQPPPQGPPSAPYGPVPNPGPYAGPNPGPGGYPPPAQWNPNQAPGRYGPPNVPNPQAYTPWLDRVIAFVIDQVPVAVILGIGYLVLMGVLVGASGSSSDGEISTGAGVAVIILLFLLSFVPFVYAVWNLGYRQGTTGQSIGKKFMKFKVVSEQTGLPIGFFKSLVRQLAHIVDGLICYIGYLFPLWDDKRQTLADKIMTTVCVPVDQQGSYPPFPPHQQPFQPPYPAQYQQPYQQPQYPPQYPPGFNGMR